MVGEIGKETEEEFANSVKQRMAEFEQLADDVLKSNDPLNAAVYQCLADVIYYYMYQNRTPKGVLDQYREQSAQHRKSLGL